MSKRADLKARIHALGEIKSILSAMKNLSIIEMNKVSRYLGAQNEMAHMIEEALGDYEAHFREERTETASAEHLYVLLGSERGFCGGYNEALLERFEALTKADKKTPKIVAIGRKLASKIDGDPRLIEIVDGPSAAEEIAGSIAELARLLTRFPNMPWTLLHHENGGSHGNVTAVCPFSVKRSTQGRRPSARPLLNLAPKELYPQLFEQYLFSVLYRAFYLSFLAENRERLRHMDGALSALDNDWNRMRRQSNILRQEEITEELEVIMLSAGI